jgi:hypothetical protein
MIGSGRLGASMCDYVTQASAFDVFFARQHVGCEGWAHNAERHIYGVMCSNT